MAVELLFAPTAQVLQLNATDTGDELVFARYSYSFVRRVLWKTIINWFKDNRFEVMPQQLLRMEEFTIQRDHWTADEMAYLEEFIDSHKGSAIPFDFTAPDDGQTYQVRFKDDGADYTVMDAVARTGTFTLVYAGDLDNSINNGLVYPSYVESTTTTTESTTTTTTESTTTS